MKEMTGRRIFAPAGEAPSIPRARQLDVKRISDIMGAEIVGVDLARVLSREILGEIQQAFLDHHLVVFRDQTLNARQVQDFASQLGEVEGHIIQGPDGAVLSAVHEVSNLDADGNPSKKPHINANYYWHSDKAYYPVTSLLTVLYAVELPPNGGETEFANMQMGYASLPEATKRRIASLRVENNFEYAMANCGKHLTAEEKRAAPLADHPIVRTHPESGNKSLFIGMYAKHVVGMPEAEGQALIKELLNHATQPAFTFRHKWRVGDLVMWDNRCLNHRAVANYEMSAFRRVLLRCVVKGSAPF
jgi:alpha-ketoglutarate-dependent taurine dioxygenase